MPQRLSSLHPSLLRDFSPRTLTTERYRGISVIPSRQRARRDSGASSVQSSQAPEAAAAAALCLPQTEVLSARDQVFKKLQKALNDQPHCCYVAVVFGVDSTRRTNLHDMLPQTCRAMMNPELGNLADTDCESPEKITLGPRSRHVGECEAGLLLRNLVKLQYHVQ